MKKKQKKVKEQLTTSDKIVTGLALSLVGGVLLLDVLLNDIPNEKQKKNIIII